MNPSVPIAVRLKSLSSDKHLTREARNLRFRSSVPGGFASCTFDLDRPLYLDPAELAIYAKVFIYDGRNGRTLWEGRLEDPARGADDTGRIWNIAAVGTMAHTEDQRAPLIYVDTGLDDFIERALTSDKAGRAENDQDVNDTPALKMSFDRGFNYANNSRIGLRYMRIYEAGLKLGRINYSWDGGKTDADWLVQAITRTTPAAAGNIARSQALNVAGGALASKVVVTNWANGDKVLELRLQRQNTAGVVPDDVSYVLFGGFTAQMLRLNADGTEKTTNYLTDTVLASDVVKDLLGRLLPQFDGANASITASTYGITQLMYENGATAREVLDDLVETFEPGFFWAAWEDTVTGKARFEFSQWPTTVTYEASAKDGFQAPGSGADLYDTVHVKWRAPNGRVRTTIRTQTVKVLTDNGISPRIAQIELEDELASSANAVRAGDQFLAQHATAPNEATLQIRRPIVNLKTGRIEQPWEIRPGTLIRVRDVKPRVDALNASDRDGFTIFRVYSVDYDAESNTATLELDSRPRAFRRIRARQGRRRVVAPRSTLQQRLSDKQWKAYQLKHRKKHPRARARRS